MIRFLAFRITVAACFGGLVGYVLGGMGVPVGIIILLGALIGSLAVFIPPRGGFPQ